MLKDITIGQYFPGKSVLHRLDPRMKILLTVGYIIMLFSVSNPLGLCVGILFLVFAYAISGIPPRMITKSLKPVIPIIIFTTVLNMFFVKGDPLFDWWIFHISRQGLLTAVVMTIRIICLIAGTSLLTYTTSPITLTDGLERLMKPLKKVHFPVHELSMMMTIALRFIPTLIEETDKIMNAQKARGADLESGGIMQRAKALVPILIPLFVSAFRRADELALAMECRCYRGDVGRTRMKQLHYSWQDGVAAALTAACIAVVVMVNIFAPVADREFYRVLRPGGVLAIGAPGPRHLFGLKEILYNAPYENEKNSFVLEGFSPLEVIRVSGEMRLESKEDIAHLFMMTPYYWKSPKEGCQRLESLHTLSTPIQFEIHLLKKTS